MCYMVTKKHDPHLPDKFILIKGRGIWVSIIIPSLPTLLLYDGGIYYLRWQDFEDFWPTFVASVDTLTMYILLMYERSDLVTPPPSTILVVYRCPLLYWEFRIMKKILEDLIGLRRKTTLNTFLLGSKVDVTKENNIIPLFFKFSKIYNQSATVLFRWLKKAAIFQKHL